MRLRQIAIAALSLLLALHTLGCNDDPGGSNHENNTTADAGDVNDDDTGADDAGDDTGTDTATDTGAEDTGTDTGTDDASDDTGADDAGTDVEDDAVSDTGGDTADTGPDVIEPPVDDLDPTGGVWSENYSAPGAVGAAGTRVYAVAKAGTNQYYIGGTFEGVGAVSAPEVAYYDGSGWSALGAGPGITPYALEVTSDGNLLVGGEGGGGGIGIGGGNTVEIWDGTGWMTLAGVDNPSSSPNSYVYDIEELSDGRLIIAGSFGGIDGSGTPNLAIWVNNNWSSIGTDAEFDGAVQEVEVIDGDICVAGDFENIGAMAASRVACWDGAQWNALGAGLPSTVFDIIGDGNGNIIAGGQFALGQPGSFEIGIAKWDGSSWSGFAGGVNGGQVTQARSLEPGDDTGEFYAGGHFSGAAGVNSVNIVKWDGSGWVSMDGGAFNEVGISGAGATGIYDMVADEGKIFTGGWFSRVGNLFTLNIARWDDTSAPGTWERLLDSGLEYLGVPGVVNSLVADGFGKVYAGGDFNFAGETDASNIALLENNSWTKLGDGTDGNVSAMALDSQGNLYAVGNFTRAGSTSVAHIAKWDGSSWTNLGPGVNSGARAIAIDSNDNVYVGGDFTRAGSVSVENVAKWDGSQWSAVGSGFDGQVTSLAIGPNDELYAGGFFGETGNGSPANRVAEFKNGAWQQIGGGIGDNSYVSEMTIYQGNLLVVGKFAEAGGDTVNSVTMWDGTAWKAFDGGLNSFGTSEATLSAVVAKENGFFVGGTFTENGGTTLNRVAWWDGTQWQPLAEGVADIPEALAVDSYRLIAGGGFTEAGGNTSYGIGVWDYSSANAQ
ncbi:MAG: hypothetical protein ACQEVA_00725 [Myxococcota bacterium]